MADNNQSERKDPPKTDSKITGALVALLVVVIGLVSFAITDSGKHWYYQFFTRASVNITFDKATTVTIIRDGVDSQTGNMGVIIFSDLRKIKHSFVAIRGTDTLKFAILIPDTAQLVTMPLTFDKKNEAPSDNTSHHSPSLKTATNSPKTVKPASPAPVLPVKSIDTPKVIPGVSIPSPIVSTKLTPDQILDLLTISVTVDPPLHVKKKFKQYTYRITASDELLNQILVVYYKRNDSSFIEMRKGYFQESDSRNDQFSFSGSQYDQQFTVYLKIKTVDNQESSVKLKRVKFE
ncbi:hypothetical protein [Chitinophaga sp.]|uniref:hypothetical protein n=1 Tax=Chitinophaga sp. TaxID=1869181 RepID=UPI0031DE28E8